MAGEGGGGGGFGAVVGALARIIGGSGRDVRSGKHFWSPTEQRTIRGYRAALAAAQQTPGLAVEGPQSDAQLRTVPVPVVYAQQPGAPQQTGSGVQQPAPVVDQNTFFDLLLGTLDLLRRYGVRLPWDPKPPGYGYGSISFTLPSIELAAPNAFPEVGMANIWNSVLTAGGQLLGGILQGAQPGGFMGGGGVYSAPMLGPGFGPVAPGGSPLTSVLSQLGQAVGGGTMDMGSPWAAGMRGATAKLFVVPNPTTGRPVWFRPAGRPVLFSGDFAACRRVRKIAGRARRRVGGR